MTSTQASQLKYIYDKVDTFLNTRKVVYIGSLTSSTITVPTGLVPDSATVEEFFVVTDRGTSNTAGGVYTNQRPAGSSEYGGSISVSANLYVSSYKNNVLTVANNVTANMPLTATGNATVTTSFSGVKVYYIEGGLPVT